MCGTPIRAMLHKGKVRVTRLLFLAVLLMLVLPAAAFPPYRSTDADTGDPYTLELRLGLVKADREDGETEVATPLLRANFGLPNKIELISEFEYLPEEDEMLQACGLELMKRIDDTRDPGPVCRAFIMAGVIVLRELFGHQFTINKLQDLINQLRNDLSERH